MSDFQQDSIMLSYLPGNDTLVIRKEDSSRVFIIAGNSVIIGRATLITIINYLLKNNIISAKVLSGLLEEYYTE